MPVSSRAVALLHRAAKIERYRRDFPSFFAQQGAIRPRSGPIIRAPLKDTQLIVDKVMDDQYHELGWIRVVEFKGRQHGGSSHGVGRACHVCYLNENVSALIVAQDDATTASLFDKAQLFYESMDDDIRPVRRFLNKQQIVLENPDPKTRSAFPGLRSRIEIQSAKNIHAAVGTTRNWLHLSELPRYGRAIQDLKGSIIPAIHLVPDTGILIEASPFGFGEARDEFRAMCIAARSRKDLYRFVGIYWWMDSHCAVPLMKGEKIRRTREENAAQKLAMKVAKEEYGIVNFELTDEQIKFRRLRIADFGRGDLVIGEQLFNQQFPIDFESGWVTLDYSVFDQFKLQQIQHRGDIRPPRRFCTVAAGRIVDTGNPDSPLWVWEDPVPGETYDIGADIATGTVGGDFSVACVLNRRTGEQVAEYRDWIGPLDFGDLLMRLGVHYNTAQLGPEVEGVGYATVSHIAAQGYPYIYQWRRRDNLQHPISQLLGWKTQSDSKKLLIATTQGALNHDEMQIRSRRLFEEMRRLVRYPTDAGNEIFDVSEGNSDCVMAYMIALQIGADENALTGPPRILSETPQGPLTLEQRNQRMKECTEFQLGSNEPDPAKGDMDPFHNLANAMKRAQHRREDSETW